MIGGGTIDDAGVVNAVVRSWIEAPLFVEPPKSSAEKSPAPFNSHLGSEPE